MRLKSNKKQISKYVIADMLAATISWISFFLFRKVIIAQSFDFPFEVDILSDVAFSKGVVIIPLFWILIYYISGEYRNIFKRSRLQELGRALFITTLGSVIIFFVLILDDTIISYKNYYHSIGFLWLVHFVLTYFPRLYFTTKTIHQIRHRVIGFSTLIVGSNARAVKIYSDIQDNDKSAGNHIVGFVTVDNDSTNMLDQFTDNLGTINDLIEVINDYKIEEVIIAIESSERKKIQHILEKIKATDVVIKAVPDLIDILSGTVRIASFFGTPLIELSHELMSGWQENVKRITDVVVSVIALVLLSPLYLFLAVGVKLSSKGPVFYSHKRIGRYGKLFSIYKYRSMFINAEQNGPALSSKNDTRITSFGRFMRKTRLDEFPQFFNVLIGDMALVGPRPERQFYARQIIKRAPYYLLLYRVRPGITSWGQVKFGYAENVDEMIERLQFDIIYLENMSIYVDLKILIYTIKTVLEGSGK